VALDQDRDSVLDGREVEDQGWILLSEKTDNSRGTGLQIIKCRPDMSYKKPELPEHCENCILAPNDTTRL
jgi:hypothetical protein